jgi:hypothetical protein
MNILTWTNPNKTCADDVIRYKVYYAPALDVAMDSLASVSPAADTFYFHRFNPGESLAACYAVSAIDSFGNESPLSPVFCIDHCSVFSLPNVFTPNGDGLNDIYTSINLNGVVEKVDMKIFNRYGQLIPILNGKGTTGIRKHD